jgi:carboxypeptidase T
MKKLTFTLFLTFIVLFVAAQTRYSRVKLFAGQNDLSELASRGLGIDHGIFKAGVYVICELSENELAIVDEAGIRYEVLIPDMTKFYAERNAPYLSRLDEIKHAKYELSRDWPVPEGFELGSCGGFLTIDQFLATLDSMAAHYPNLISPRHTMNYQTHNGRDLYWVRISNNPNVDQDKPEVLYTGMHHAREPIGMQLLVYYMYYLLENYDSDPDVQYIVNNFELYFVPILNMDGYAYNIQNQPNGGGEWRKNRRQNDDGSYGVDINRNYGYMWGYDDNGSSPYPWDDTYRGPSSFSEPEIMDIRDFCNEHEFRFAINYHSFANDCLYPWGWTPELCPDDPLFHIQSVLLTKENGYLYGPSNTTIYPTNGGSDDWMYGEQSTKGLIYSYTPEVGDGTAGFWPSPSMIIPLCQENMWQNIMAVRLSGIYAIVTDKAPSIVENKTGLLFFDLQRVGLEDGTTYTVSIEPLNDAFLSISDPLTFTGLDILETANGAFTYTLKDDIQSGEPVEYLLSFNNGLATFSDTIRKIYGTPVVIFEDSASNFNNWSSNKWNTTTQQYHSAPKSITDSPFGQYSNNETNVITMNDQIDLADVVYASLGFWAKWDIEAGYDYVQLLVSDNNGASWTPMQGKYTKTGNSYQEYGEPLYDGIQSDWVKEEINLSQFLGENIKLRFVLHSDQYTVGDGFYFDDMAVTVVDLETGIPDNIQSSAINKISVQPNPAINTVNISYNLSTPSGSNTLSVFDILGEKVYETRLETNSGSVILDVSSWSEGMYFYAVMDDQKIIASGKLIVK